MTDSGKPIAFLQSDASKMVYFEGEIRRGDIPVYARTWQPVRPGDPRYYTIHAVHRPAKK